MPLGAGLGPALFVVAAALAQPQTEVRVSGRVVDGEGAAVPSAPIRARWLAPGLDLAAASTRTSADGSFELRLRFPRTALEDAHLLVSTEHEGVPYSAPPILGPEDRVGPLQITVFDTAQHAAPPDSLAVAARRLFLRPSGPLRVEVLDAVELENPTRRTWVAAPGGVLWRAAIPAGAEAAQVIDAQVAASSVQTAGDTVRVLGPLLPGHNQLILRYFLPVGTRALRLPLGSATAELEVLIAEALGGRGVGKLRAHGSTRVGEEPFRRFVASNLSEGDEVGFSLGPDSELGVLRHLLPALLFALLVGGAAFWRQRASRPLAAEAEAE